MKIYDIIERGLIMPQTIKPMGLIHLPGTGPNNRLTLKTKVTTGQTRHEEHVGTDINKKGTRKKAIKWCLIV